MHYEYDFALAGSTGQIGSVLLGELGEIGTVYPIKRAEDLDEIPSARHVVNAAGYTKFDNNFGRYWQDNIRFAVSLATIAKERDSDFHQLSSEAVAEFRENVLSETEGRIRAHPLMNHYALSKVLTEQAVRSIMSPERLHIYRCSDVVPGANRMVTQWRENHWLSILFAYGKRGFADNDAFPVWIATVDDMAAAIAILVSTSGYPTHHLLGHVYNWWQFYDSAQNKVETRHQRRKLVEQVTPVIRIEPPLATCISQAATRARLEHAGFYWEKLGFGYWTDYGRQA